MTPVFTGTSEQAAALAATYWQTDAILAEEAE